MVLGAWIEKVLNVMIKEEKERLTSKGNAPDGEDIENMNDTKEDIKSIEYGIRRKKDVKVYILKLHIHIYRHILFCQKHI